MKGGAAWGPPASPDRLDFLGKDGGLTGDRRDRTLITRITITESEMLPEGPVEFILSSRDGRRSRRRTPARTSIGALPARP